MSDDRSPSSGDHVWMSQPMHPKNPRNSSIGATYHGTTSKPRINAHCCLSLHSEQLALISMSGEPSFASRPETDSPSSFTITTCPCVTPIGLGRTQLLREKTPFISRSGSPPGCTRKDLPTLADMPQTRSAWRCHHHDSESHQSASHPH